MRQFLPVSPDHIALMMEKIRGVDLGAFERAGINPHQTITDALSSSTDTCTAMLDDELACIWGIIPIHIIPAVGFLWMMTTPKIEDQTFVFLRHSQLAIDALMKKYDRLETLVDTSMERSIKYIEWLKFKPLATNFHNQKSFTLFAREREEPKEIT